MHGNKKWIRDYTGRYKKSNDRSWKDWRGDLNRSYTVLRDEEYNCPECKVKKDEVGNWVHPVRYVRDTEKRWKVIKTYTDTSTTQFIIPPYSECEEHRLQDRRRWNGNPYSYYSNYYTRGTPRHFRKEYNQRERGRVKQMLHMAKYDEDIYDDLHDKQMLKLGYYW